MIMTNTVNNDSNISWFLIVFTGVIFVAKLAVGGFSWWWLLAPLAAVFLFVAGCVGVYLIATRGMDVTDL